MSILRHANNSSRKLSFIFIFASNVSGVRTSVCHRDSESLRSTYSDICVHLSRGLDDSATEKICDNNQESLVLMKSVSHLRVVEDVSQVIRILHNDSSVVCCFEIVELSWIVDNEFNVHTFSSCLDDRDGLGVDGVRNKDLLSLSSVYVVNHEHGFSSRGHSFLSTRFRCLDGVASNIVALSRSGW